jgi:hypothetical protein
MTELTASEITFAKRMLPHFMAGKTFEQAADAVLEDDVRLLVAVIDNSHGYLGFNDQSHYYTDTKAKGLASALSDEVYRRLQDLALTPHHGGTP